MATIIGQNIFDIIAATNTDQAIHAFDIPFVESSRAKPYMIPEIRTGQFSHNLPLINASKRATQGTIQGIYGELFYNRVLVEPIEINAGAIVTDQTWFLKVFNGYLTTKHLEALTINNDTNIEFLNPNIPDDFLALTEKEYTLSIKMIGRLRVDATVLFDFTDNSADTLVYITGMRLETVPFMFPFTTKLTEEISWLTTKLTSYNNTSQYIQVRQSPRVALSVTSEVTGFDQQEMQNVLYFAGNRNTIGLPFHPEARSPMNTLTTGDMDININTNYADFRDESTIVIFESPQKFELGIISATETNKIYLTQPIKDTYNQSVQIAPYRAYNITSQPKLSQKMGSSEVKFKAWVKQDRLPVYETLDQYQGTDICPFSAQYSTNKNYTQHYKTRTETLDFESGVTQSVSPWKTLDNIKNIRFLLQGQEQAWRLRSWLHQLNGRQKKFWIVIQNLDFTFVPKIDLITTTIWALDNKHNVFSPQKTEIVIIKKDGSRIFRTISSITKSPEGYLAIFLSANINTPASEISYICYNSMCRLASDKVTLQWRPRNIIDVNLQIIEDGHGI